MSWNDIHKLKPQKLKPESEQDLYFSSEFLVWDMEFKSKHLSNECSNRLSQEMLSNDSALLQSSDMLETCLNPQNPKQVIVYGFNYLGIRVPIDSFSV